MCKCTCKIACKTTCTVHVQQLYNTYLSSQMTALRSKWLVGSSNSNNVGSMNRALGSHDMESRVNHMTRYLANETLILHPPENLIVALPCISIVNPKP